MFRPAEIFAESHWPNKLNFIHKVGFQIEAHSEPSQTSKMEVFVNIVNGLKPLCSFQEKLHVRCLNEF